VPIIPQLARNTNVGPKGIVDLGGRTGPWSELSALLSRLNGFFLFNAGVHVYRAGQQGLGYDIEQWNDAKTWKYTYEGLADDLFCFGQDVLGTQFAIVANREIVAFEPETGRHTTTGDSLAAWAAWLLEEPAIHGTSGLARTWQDQKPATGAARATYPATAASPWWRIDTGERRRQGRRRMHADTRADRVADS
jgi:hypothetical protein